MRKIFILLLLTIGFYQAHCQTYDLIITSGGDSVACFIDSVSNNTVYFEMKAKGHWIKTHSSVSDVIGYHYDVFREGQLIFEPGSSKIKDVLSDMEQHSFTHRYLFSPTAYPLKKKDTYYNTYYLMIHDVQHGFGDRFSMTFGTSTFLFPYYVISQYAIPVNEKSSFAVGDLLLFFPWDGLYVGNLVYGIYTYGNKSNNFTVGAGLWSTNKNDISATGHKAAITLSGKVSVSRRVSLISENYLFQMNVYGIAQHFDPVNPYEYDYEELFIKMNTIAFGLAGVRFKVLRKAKPRSWQIGLLYVLIDEPGTPEQYKTSEWERNYFHDGGQFFFVLPTISYTRKF